MDIFDNIRNKVYEADGSDLEKITSYVICGCEKKYLVKIKDTPRFCSECGKPVKEKVEEAFRINQEIRTTFNKKSEELREQFKKDLFEYYGISDNPKREKAYDYAWEHGHSGGIYEVTNIMADLIDLIK
jgi:hypothetical protein